MRYTAVCLFIGLFCLSACAYNQNNSSAFETLPNPLDRRTSKTVSIDEQIEIKLREDLNNDPLIPFQSHVNVNAFNGTLLLTGEAPYEQLHQLIVDKARIIKGVKRVQDEISVAPPTHPASHSADSLITNRIKTELDNIHEPMGFKSSNIRIVTENSSVYLLGLVYEDEAEIVTTVAQKTTGVTKVVKLFEYLQ